MPPKVIFIAGPTASGKTQLAIEIATRFPCEIVSVDSAMVYRGMDVGTAKPAPEILKRVSHHLVDICDPSDPYSAARFRLDALREIEAILHRGGIPLLVGGTMLYFRALESGLSSLPAADPGTRSQLESEARRDGWPALHARLALVDPLSARRIHPNDPQRVQRALEVYEVTGRPMAELLKDNAGEPLPFDVVKLHIFPDSKERLGEQIAERLDGMLKAGLVQEVETLYRRGDLHPGLPSIRAVGYRQLWRYLDGETDLQAAVRAAAMATRQLAKRQLTWMRADCTARRFVAGSHQFTSNVLKYIGTVASY